MNNQLPMNTQRKEKFSVVLQKDAIKKLINNTLVDPKRCNNFIANISSAVAVNPALQECDSFTIINGSLLGESLNLSPSPQLGHYYLVPFNDKERGKVATFQLGYKGYIQLAMRSGQYKKLNVLAIKEGELISYDPLNEEIKVKLIEDDEIRENTKTIGYYAMFEYINGFRKAIYWSKKKMESHARKYSQGYANDLRKGITYTFWSKDFDGMAYKTMLRQLISKWGIMSTELQKAIEKDLTYTDKDGKANYFETENSDMDDVSSENTNTIVVEESTGEIATPKEKTSVKEDKGKEKKVAPVVKEEPFEQANLFQSTPEFPGLL